LYMWTKDLMFYAKHKWDFSKDNGVRGVGPSADSFPALYEFSPKTRVTFYYPVLLAVSLLASIELGRQMVEMIRVLEQANG
jgi:hypothetical protein